MTYNDQYDPTSKDEVYNTSSSAEGLPRINLRASKVAHLSKDPNWDSDEVPTGDISGSQMWAKYSGNRYAPCDEAHNELLPGVYTIEWADALGYHFLEKKIVLDELLVLPDDATNELLSVIKQFWESEHKFREFGFLWKRGVLLYGPPGSGKTSTIQLLMKQLVDNGGIAVYINDPRTGAAGLEVLRRVEPNRPIIVTLEDLDAIIGRYGETELLALLDGELQIDNVVFLATTNYPEELDKRLKNRPSRFDYVRKIPMPSEEARQFFLEHKNPRLIENRQELNLWVAKTNGFSVSHLKELIIAVEVFGNDFDTAVTKLRRMIEVNITSQHDEDKPFGFID